MGGCSSKSTVDEIAKRAAPASSVDVVAIHTKAEALEPATAAPENVPEALPQGEEAPVEPAAPTEPISAAATEPAAKSVAAGASDAAAAVAEVAALEVSASTVVLRPRRAATRITPTCAQMSVCNM